MRDYNSDTDYWILLAAIKNKGAMSIIFVARSLYTAGISWPHDFALDNTAASVAIDRDISRAWRELQKNN